MRLSQAGIGMAPTLVTFDFHKTSALSTLRLPAVAEGWAVTPIDVSGVTLFSPVVDGGQIGVACTASYGYAQYRVSATLIPTPLRGGFDPRATPTRRFLAPA